MKEIKLYRANYSGTDDVVWIKAPSMFSAANCLNDIHLLSVNQTTRELRDKICSLTLEERPEEQIKALANGHRFLNRIYESGYVQ